jgi:galactokinase
VAAAARDDRHVDVLSLDLDASAAFGLDGLAPGDHVGWIDYVRGVAAELEAAGVMLGGADLVIESDIPAGAGLSSSAALELAAARAFLALAGEAMRPERLAVICQRAEHRFAGVRCGIMDQYTVACAKRRHALLLDCRSLAVTQVAIPRDIGFVLTDSGVRHRLPDGDYNNRADECAAALELLSRQEPGLRSLRDADLAMLDRHGAALGDPLYRRCRHVVSENARVEQAVAALRTGASRDLGALLDQSHASLRDDYEVSCAEVDAVVELANASPAVCGSRMIGGGFGGCVLSVTAIADLGKACEDIRAGYIGAFGREPWMHIVRPAHPAQEFVAG